MINLLTRLFIKNSEDVNNPDVRASYGNISGIIGIVLNLILFALKLTAGIISASVSIIADAFNNLSDSGSSVVTFIGFRLARKPADKEHPFGHGRYEYIAGLGISVVILLVGIELVKSSVEKLFSPEKAAKLDMFSVIALAVSIAVKFWMYFFNKNLSKKINSKALKAASLDSLTDCAATSVVLSGLAVSYFTGKNIDGWLGIAVAAFIIYTGIATCKESLSPLLGNPPDDELAGKIKQTVLNEPIVEGIHDMIVHDYGVGRCVVSLHAEISDKRTLVEAHKAIDRVEKELEKKFNCMATIHLDPVAIDDRAAIELKNEVADKMCDINSEISIHDFRVEKESDGVKLVFELTVPYSCKLSEEQILCKAKEKIAEINPSYTALIQIERPYISC